MTDVEQPASIETTTSIPATASGGPPDVSPHLGSPEQLEIARIASATSVDATPTPLGLGDGNGSIVISRSNLVTTNIVRRFRCSRTASALAALLFRCADPSELEPWWCSAVWRNNRRAGHNWEFADVVAIEADHVSKRPEKRPVSAEERAELDAILQSLPGNVTYHTPRGLRLIAILDYRNADPDLQRRAQAGFSALAATALAPLAWLQVDAGVTTAALSQPLYCPRGNSKGPGTNAAREHPLEAESGPRDARCVVLREELYRACDLAAHAPPEPVRTSRIATTAASAVGPRPARADNTIDDAVASWNRAHPQSYDTDQRECPVCRHFGCFGELPAAPERWHCFSSNHPSEVGRPAPSGMGCTGDGLDLAAFERQLTRIEVLREDGYLDDRPFGAAGGAGRTVPSSDSIVVHDIEEAQAHVRKALKEWPIGERSREIAGAAGGGKTTAGIVEFADRIRAGSLQIGIIALHTAALVAEKAKRARAIIGDDSIAVIELLGARPDDSLGFFCEEPERRASAAELGLFACSGCPFLEDETCESTPGRFRHDSLDALARIESGSGTLVFTTHARAPQLLDELRDAGLSDRFAIVIDDDGSPCSGLLRETEIDADIADAALEHAATYTARTSLPIAWRAWESWFLQYASACYAPSLRNQQPHGPIADVATRVLDAIVRTATADNGRPVAESQPLAVVAAELRAQHPVFVEALVGHAVPNAAWIWQLPLSDDGPDHRPALTRELLRLLALELIGHSVTVVPVVRNPRRPHVVAWKVRSACVSLARAAADGRVCFLSVGPLPRAVVESLRIKSVLLEAEPRMLTTLQLDEFLFGTRRPQPALVLAIWTALFDTATRPGGINFGSTSYTRPGAILRKRDRDVLIETHRAAYGASGHFGRAHAATDAFADRDLLFVSRTSLPPGTSEATGRALVAAFPEIIAETPDRAAALTELGNDIEQSWRRQHMLNAVGRLRGLSASRRKLVVVADGVAVPGLFVDESWSIDELVDEFGVDGRGILAAKAAIENAREQTKANREEAQALKEAAEELDWVLLRTEASKIAAEWWDLWRAPITARDLGEILAGRGFKLTRAELRELRCDMAASVSQFGAETGSSTNRAYSGAELRNVSLPTTAALVQRVELSQATAYRVLRELRGWLAGGPAPTLGRSDRARNWAVCARAIRELMIEAGTWEVIAGHPFAVLTKADDGGGPSSFGRSPADRSRGSIGSCKEPGQQQATTSRASGRRVRSRARATLVGHEEGPGQPTFVASSQRADLADSTVLRFGGTRVTDLAVADRVDYLTEVGQECRAEEIHRVQPFAPSRRVRGRSRRPSTTRARSHRAPSTPLRLRRRAAAALATPPPCPRSTSVVAPVSRSNSEPSNALSHPPQA